MGQLSTSLDQHDQREIVRNHPAAAFDLRFVLTEPEWREGTHLLHPIVGTSYTKPWIRLFWGICAIANLMMPSLHGHSWGEMFSDEPLRAAVAGLMVLICAWGATGIGMKSLDHRLNRLDLDRHIVVTEQGVTITWNQRTWNYAWKDFVYFRETANVVILRNPGIRFWTIPLRALPPGSEARFRELLHSKLPRRQPYSWSPNS